MEGRGRRLTALAPALAAAVLLAACGAVNDPVPAGAPPSTPPSTPATPAAIGEQQEVGRGLVLRVSADSAGGDDRRSWVNVMMNVENRTAGDLPFPRPALRCAQSDALGEPRDPATDDDILPAGASAGRGFELLLPPGADGAPVRTCRAPAYVEVGDARWLLTRADLEYVNAELRRDPGRPYRWTAIDDRFSSGYQVAFVPGATAAEALAALAPVKRKVSQERFWAVRVAERDDGVVLFTWGLISDERIAALSRIDGVAASYGNTVNGDDHVLVARDGRVVRSFDPFLAYAHDRSRPLPEEKGLDLEEDTGPASWTLLERLTSMSVTEEWLLDPAHPAYLLGQE
ncbi:hypothetical protein [Pimelobacter sp. 30-1]|uniref:hypothetical protein n=1 Tax=Pimelobacter sp. 30-1 TaxID=2004991 RepID=UPI001C0495E7|nr:hypothetical protein [Pimelobacter sp. 30-1]MBU2695972.1 hypothetical protein [Pimelobacter sp. 30-1]